MISVAAKNALAAAIQAVEAAKALSSDGEPKLEIIVALHVGTAFYGNIGAADRLDFTVIGPAVNLVSRIEAVGKALNIPIIVSDDFARSYGKPLHPLGRYVLRGTRYTPRTICTGFATVRSLLTRKSRIGQLWSFKVRGDLRHCGNP